MIHVNTHSRVPTAEDVLSNHMLCCVTMLCSADVSQSLSPGTLAVTQFNQVKIVHGSRDESYALAQQHGFHQG